MMFTGLAVGGPIAGQIISFTSPLYRVPVREVLPTYIKQHVPEESVPVKVYEYRHITGIRHKDKLIDVDFWVSANVVTDHPDPVVWALEHIFRDYARLVNAAVQKV